ncbi:MAG: HK97 family phage prohead protease [Paracoccaceae bacterium]
MNLTGAHNGGLELRRENGGAVRLAGRFPYGKRAVLSDGGRTGRPRKEIIASRAFAYRVERPEEDIHFLVGHSYDRPLASRSAGTLDIQDSEEALVFEAVISAEMQRVSFVADFLGAFSAGLIVGLSPGFRIPPPRTVPDAETVEEEDPSEGTALIRTVNQALLYEVSAVTRPAYDEAQIEARSWDVRNIRTQDASLQRAMRRWMR